MGSLDRRTREKAQRRDDILNSARTLLFKKGMGAASMNQIARHAELSVGTLYLYFTNKEELFAALQEEGLDLLFDMIQSAGKKGKTVHDKLRNMAVAYLDFSIQQKNYFEIINYFLASPEIMFPAKLKARVDSHGDKILSLVVDLLKEGGADKKTDLDQKRRCALIFWSSLHGALQFRKLKGTLFTGQSHRTLYMAGFECVYQGIVRVLEDA